MFIPPFFPEPIEAPGNVAGRSYDERLVFIRRLSGLLLGMALLSTSVAVWAPMPIYGAYAAWALLGLAALHSLTRKINGLAWTGYLFAPAMAMAWGWTGAWLHGLGWPTLVLPLTVAGAAIYVLVAGRDFSFVGQFVLGSFAMALGWIALFEAGLLVGLQFGWGWILGVAFLGYLTYDQAMILKRRRPDEALASVCDLTSDLLNWISYGGRVWAHWRRFKW